MRPEYSLDIIAAMMSQTRRNVLRDSSTPFLVWGWTTVVVGIMVYVSISLTGNPQSYLMWFLLPAIGMVIMAFKRRKQDAGSRTVLDRPLNSIWTMLTVVLVCFSVSSYFISFNVLFFILLVLSIGCFVTGAIIKYPLLRWASVIGFAVDASLLMVSNPKQILLFVLAIAGMMILPGYKMKQDLKNERT